jgi:hypothetical protein
VRRVEHRAYLFPEPSGTWAGGCEACEVSWVAEPCWHRAAAWCSGHNHVLTRLDDDRRRFPLIGPGDAITLARLFDRVEEAAGAVGWEAEIVQPVTVPPILCVWTPAEPEGWKRERLGTIIIERAGSFMPESRPALRSGRHRAEP